MSNQIVISSGAKVRSLNGVITGTTGVLDSLPINAANGIPQLDVNGKILVSQLPNSVMEYQGTWNASTNTPTLVNGTGNQGDVYLCNVAGTVNFGAGPIAFVVGDQVIYSGSIWQRASGSTGTVTSVAVTESGDALTITGSPITTSGTINIGFAGTSAQYVAGNGALVTFPDLTGYVTLTTTQTISGVKTFTNSNVFSGANLFTTWSMRFDQGTAIKETANFGSTLGYTTIGGAVNGLALKLSDDGKKTFAFANATTNNTYTFPDATGTVALTSDISYPVSSVFGRTGAVVATEGDYSLTQLSDVTITTPSSGQVLKYNGTAWVNDSDTDTGITSLNGLTATTQTFAVGTSGTDFAISSATATHTFNLPTASAANRGALSSADWTTFNNKQSTLSLTTTGNSGSATLVSNTLNVPTYTLAGLGGISLTSLSATTPLSYNNTTGAFSIQVANTSQDGYLSSTDWNTFNGKQNTITNPVTGTGTSGQVTYFNGTSSVTSSSSFKFDGTNLTIGNPSSALAQLHIYNASAAASFLLQTNSTTDYSEIAVRNNSSTATSYFRQYSTAATGSDFGISRAGLALFFSNYATNFAIGTRNGGDLILGTADTERARITSIGNFGLGTSTPSRDPSGTRSLAISGASLGYAASLDLYATRNYAIYTGGSGSLGFYDLTANAERLTIASTGAATFSSSVTIEGNGSTIRSGNELRFNRADNAIYTRMYDAGSGAANGFILDNTNGEGFHFKNTTTTLMRMNSAGNVGIGTSSPSSLLQLAGGGTGTRGAMRFSDAGLSNYWEIGRDNSVSGDFTFNSNATERMRITSGGDVFINATSGGNEKFNVTQSGAQWATAINHTNSTQFFMDLRYNGTQTGSIIGSGGVTSYNVTSDYRLKEDFKNYNGLELISKIKTYDFEFKQSKLRMYGVIAHELQEVIPYAVFGEKDAINKDGSIKPQGVDYSKLVPLLVKAIQEQQKQIEELKLKIK